MKQFSNRKRYEQALIEKFNYKSKNNLYVSIWDLIYEYEDNIDISKELNKLLKKIDKTKLEELHKLTMEFFDEEKEFRRFFYRGNPCGYGYEVIERINGSFKVRYFSYEKEKVIEALSLIREDNQIDESNLPDNTNETPKSKIFFVEDRYGRYYYEANTEKQFKEKAVEFLIHNYNNNRFYKPDDNLYDIDKKLGMSESDIEKLPEGSIKEFALSEVKKINEGLRRHKEHQKVWDSLREIVKNKSLVKTSAITRVLSFFYNRNSEWDIIETE